MVLPNIRESGFSLSDAMITKLERPHIWVKFVPEYGGWAGGECTLEEEKGEIGKVLKIAFFKFEISVKIPQKHLPCHVPVI